MLRKGRLIGNQFYSELALGDRLYEGTRSPSHPAAASGGMSEWNLIAASEGFLSRRMIRWKHVCRIWIQKKNKKCKCRLKKLSPGFQRTR